MDVAALEKRRCNALLAQSRRFERALDAFAGVGVSACYWSRCARELYLVENRPAALRLLRSNLAAIRRRGCRVHVVAASAHDFLEEAITRGLDFDLVDCDPFGTCYEILPLVAQVVHRGVVCVTSGEIFQVYRGLNRRPGRPPADSFRGRQAYRWVRRMLIPELRSHFDQPKLVHFYAYPTSVRAILTVGGFRLSPSLFIGRPHVLGWLAQTRSASAHQARAEGNAQTVG